jgi:excisionase family DNA binding protein
MLKVKPPDDDAVLLTVPEACRMLRCSRATLYKLRNAGRIDMLKLGHRTTRVTKQSIDRLMHEQSRPVSRGDAA